MRPKKLKICAWGPYRGLEEVDFEAFLERGIFLVTGATGAGKTTIFDAISYALYGSLSGEERDKERNSVRSDFADAQVPTFVELVMEHGGKVYTIKRNPEFQRPKKRGDGQTFTLQKENAILEYEDGRVLEGVREVNAALKEILVLDYQQFKKISMIAQGEFAKLLVAPPKDKTKIFREIFGTGIYERFTKELSNRSRKLYAKVEESKSKLGEDMRMLTEGMEKSRWSEEAKEHLRKLEESEYCNQEALKLCLNNMSEEVQASLKSATQQFEEADKRVEQLAARLTEQAEINRKLEQYEHNEQELALLEEKGEEYAQKEQIYKAAINAQFVAGLEEKKIQIQKRMSEMEESIGRVARDKKALFDERETLVPVLDKADKVRELLETAQKTQEQQLQYERDFSLWKKRQEGFAKKQTDYLEKEKEYREQRADYEEEEHKRRMTAVGLAATLLVEGKPCPVCGSVEHPCPAGTQMESISEEQLLQKKKKLERMNEQLREAESGIAAERALLENSRQKLEELEKDISALKKILEQETDALCLVYLDMKPMEARNKLEKQCRRAGEIEVLLQEKKEQEDAFQKQCRELEHEYALVKQDFQEALAQHGFSTAADYEQVKKNKAECDLLQKEILNYQSRVATCRQLKEHLRECVTGLERQPITLLQETLEQAKEERSTRLKTVQKWEKHKSELKKTSSLVNANLTRIEEESEKYGYVKDLENMAIGNNSRRLVFEQYVLAGYFEEILRAANLRFGKMTSGRYEMFRVDEVGDGRVKDNLEIRIMDYYTGKMRSVRTLSGGESFKASLALALGMSDVIQAMNGGIRVDTLFVDEGFGALDSESLDQACDALMSLVENNHLIGIISHVPQLRERIESQLVIEKTNSGSVIKNSVY